MSELISRVGNTTITQTEEKITFSITGSGTDIVSRINESPSDGTVGKNLRICMDGLTVVPKDLKFK